MRTLDDDMHAEIFRVIYIDVCNLLHKHPPLKKKKKVLTEGHIDTQHVILKNYRSQMVGIILSTFLYVRKCS